MEISSIGYVTHRRALWLIKHGAVGEGRGGGGAGGGGCLRMMVGKETSAGEIYKWPTETLTSLNGKKSWAGRRA